MTVYYLMNFPGVTPLPPTGDDLRAAYDVAPPEIKEPSSRPTARRRT